MSKNSEAGSGESDLWQQVVTASSRLADQIIDFGFRKFGMHINEAWQDYNISRKGKPFDPQSAENPIFIPYFLYRWQNKVDWEVVSGWVPEGGTIVRAFLISNSHRLSPLEKTIAETSMRMPFSFFEILSSQPGQGMEVQDVFTGQKFDVKERAASASVRTGDIIYGQLTPMSAITTMAFCAPLVIPPAMKPLIVTGRRMLRTLLRTRARNIAVNDLPDVENEIRSIYLRIRDELSAPPILCNTDGDRFVVHTITFAIESPQAAFDALSPLSYGTSPEEWLSDAEYDSNGALQKVYFEWRKPGNSKFENWDNTILGKLDINGKELRVEVNSKERAAQLWKEIENRLGTAAQHKNTAVRTIDDLRKSDLREEEAPSPAAKPDGPSESDLFQQDPEVQRSLRDFMQKQVDAWMNREIPALGGRTPLQAVKNADGRESVAALLLDYERHANKNFPEPVRPDFSKLRQILFPGPKKRQSRPKGSRKA